MSLHTIIVKSEKFLGDNSPMLLSGLAVAGTLTTAYLTGKATLKAEKIVRHEKRETTVDWALMEPKELRLWIFKMIWKEYIPPVTAATLTITAIILANRIGTRRTAAMAAAYTMAERGFQEYREKVTETIGKKKETEIRDAVAQDQVTRAGIHSNTVIIGTGDCIFVDGKTMRPFMSTMQDVKKSINDINWKINTAVYASLNDWYDKVGLPRTEDGDDLGWSNALLEPHITTTITDDEKPAFLIKFLTQPIRNYDKLHP